jgi:hypothetical protein
MVRGFRCYLGTPEPVLDEILDERTFPTLPSFLKRLKHFAPSLSQRTVRKRFATNFWRDLG